MDFRFLIIFSRLQLNLIIVLKFSALHKRISSYHIIVTRRGQRGNIKNSLPVHLVAHPSFRSSFHASEIMSKQFVLPRSSDCLEILIVFFF